ncbi:MAG: hypothetical protein WDO71_20110 [Bacteroidota bacterium]
MTLYQFNALDEMEQAEALWEKGVHIGERFDEEHNILLYQIDGFYLEAYYHREYNVLMRFRTFSSLEQLTPYLEKLNINYE